MTARMPAVTNLEALAGLGVRCLGQLPRPLGRLVFEQDQAAGIAPECRCQSHLAIL